MQVVRMMHCRFLHKCTRKQLSTEHQKKTKILQHIQTYLTLLCTAEQLNYYCMHLPSLVTQEQATPGSRRLIRCSSCCLIGFDFSGDEQCDGYTGHVAHHDHAQSRVYVVSA